MLEVWPAPACIRPAKKIAGGRLVDQGRAHDGEKTKTLDGKERSLSGRTLVIADSTQALVIAGIMGGENSGVDASTTSIVLECAIFRAVSVRWTSRSLGLSSDSSYRYERGVDPHTAKEAAWRAIDLIMETSGGSVTGPVCVVGGDVPWRREVVLSSAFVRERLGFDIPAPEMRAALESLELNITRDDPEPHGGALWTVSIPSWRATTSTGPWTSWRRSFASTARREFRRRESYVGRPCGGR